MESAVQTLSARSIGSSNSGMKQNGLIGDRECVEKVANILPTSVTPAKAVAQVTKRLAYF